MAYVLLDENNIVIQKDVDQHEGFIEAPDNVVCGQIKVGSCYQNPEISEEFKREQISENRKSAYRAESDPLFFKFQAGEATEQEWLDKRIEIKDRIK